ncbi:MAG: ComEA family DNA-binding protein [Erysipelotrichia bacterium]|nr:ComEA family DNA-binding protein [Erysipelotrichia bacterium]
MKKILYWFSLLFLLTFFLFPNDDKIDLANFKTKQIQVEVKGEVTNPGVFQINAYSKIEDLLKMVQLKDTAELSTINKNTVLKNNDVLVIPKKSDQVKISINSASLEQLCQIPFIGEKTAQKIIDYREQYGSFQQLEDLLNIKGIGEKKLEKIIEYICL